MGTGLIWIQHAHSPSNSPHEPVAMCGYGSSEEARSLVQAASTSGPSNSGQQSQANPARCPGSMATEVINVVKCAFNITVLAIADAVKAVLKLWRKLIRHPVAAAIVTLTMLSFGASVFMFAVKGDIPILHGLQDGKLRPVVAVVAIGTAVLGDMFPIMLAWQSRVHEDGGLEAKRRAPIGATPGTLIANAVLAVLFPVVRTMYNAGILCSFLAGHNTMPGFLHTNAEEFRVVSWLVLAAFMVLCVPTYQLGFVARCITAHKAIKDAADEWKAELSKATTTTNPATCISPEELVKKFNTAASEVETVNKEYSGTLGLVLVVRTLFILAYTSLQLLVGDATSSWVYVISPALELLNLLYAAATVTQQHHDLVKAARTASFTTDTCIATRQSPIPDAKPGHGAAGGAGSPKPAESESEVQSSPPRDQGMEGGKGYCMQQGGARLERGDHPRGFTAAGTLRQSPTPAPVTDGAGPSEQDRPESKGTDTMLSSPPLPTQQQDRHDGCACSTGQWSLQFMVCANRLADHVLVHRSRLAIRVKIPIEYDVTRRYVLRLTVGIGTSLLTLFVKDIIIENLRAAGIHC